MPSLLGLLRHLRARMVYLRITSPRSSYREYQLPVARIFPSRRYWSSRVQLVTVFALSSRVPRSICFQRAPTIVRSSGQGLRRFLNVSADATIMFQMRKDILIGSSSFSAIGE